ncbi:Clp protease N-terminal domain-containing protein [Monashia sp. NPDC004114]
MFERFTDTARGIVVRAQDDARRLGHDFIGSEHLLLAVAATDEPAGAVLRGSGITPERVEAEILRTVGRGPAADPLSGLDREALAFIGIDLDVVRARIEAAFGQDDPTRDHLAARRGRRPTRGKGPLAEIARRARRRRGRSDESLVAGSAYCAHLRFTPRSKQSLELALREAKALHDNYIGVEHLTLGLLAMQEGTVPGILSTLGSPAMSLRAAVLATYRKAS